METPSRQFQRVLLALEDLIGQEENLLRAEDFAAIPALQSRAAPLVDFLTANAHVADDLLRRKVAALVARRAQSEKLLSRQVAQVREELLTVQKSRQRLAQVMPAYRRQADVPADGQLCARG